MGKSNVDKIVICCGDFVYSVSDHFIVHKAEPFWYNLFNFQFKYYSRCGVQGYVIHYILVSGDIEFKVVLFLGNHKISISVLAFVVRQSLQSVVSSNGYWEICVFFEVLLLKTVPEASIVRRLRSVTYVQS